MLIRLLGDFLSSTAFFDNNQFGLERGTMVNGAGSVIRWLAGLLALQTALADYAPPPVPVLSAGQHGAVASESDICSHIGIDLLKLGGNAADAMVGTVACIGVIGMYHSGKFMESNQLNCTHKM
jgi:gamma-glutamyltranspeptidase/glutathione hydrolase